MPQFFTGLKIAVTYSYVSAIVAEFVGAQQGLGVYMTTSKNAFRTDLVFGAVLVTARSPCCSSASSCCSSGSRCPGGARPRSTARW